jgi:hypothetical protein
VTDLPARLRHVAELVELSRLPAPAVAELEAAVAAPAVRRALRDDAIAQLAALGLDGAAIYRLISSSPGCEGWRWATWRRLYAGPKGDASPIERLAFAAWNASPRISLRQVQRVLERRHYPPSKCRRLRGTLSIGNHRRSCA